MARGGNHSLAGAAGRLWRLQVSWGVRGARLWLSQTKRASAQSYPKVLSGSAWFIVIAGFTDIDSNR